MEIKFKRVGDTHLMVHPVILFSIYPTKMIPQFLPFIIPFHVANKTLIML